MVARAPQSAHEAVMRAPARALPFLAWPRPTRESLAADLSAGTAVALLVIPQSLAYAQLAGMPPQHGLYAALLPSIVGVMFGSSALLSTGPVAMTSMLTASSVGLLAVAGSEQYVMYVLLLALLSGLFQIGLGLARAGLLLNLLSHPVLVGFINAAAIVIGLSQLPALTGITIPAGNSTLAGVGVLLTQWDQVHLPSLGMGLLALVIMLGFRRWAPARPGLLVMVAVLTLLSFAIGYADRGGAVVGTVPTGLPSLSLPAANPQAMIDLLPAAFVVALVSFMEAMSSCKVIADKTRTPWDENRELIGQGLAKVVAAFCHSMPVSGSFSRSALNLSARARSGYSSLVTAALVLVVVVFFTSLLYHLPKSALAAMILLAVANLLNGPAMRQAWRTSRDDGMAALLSFVATLAFAPNIQNGIVVGILFSLGAFIYRRMKPRIVVYALADDGSTRELGRGMPHRERVVALRFDAALFFVNASFFEDAVLELDREHPGLECIVVLAQGINILDATGVEMLRYLVHQLRERRITLVVSQAQRQFVEVCERTGLMSVLGRDNVFETHAAALDALRKRRTPPATAAPATPEIFPTHPLPTP